MKFTNGSEISVFHFHADPRTLLRAAHVLKEKTDDRFKRIDFDDGIVHKVRCWTLTVNLLLTSFFQKHCQAFIEFDDPSDIASYLGVRMRIADQREKVEGVSVQYKWTEVFTDHVISPHSTSLDFKRNGQHLEAELYTEKRVQDIPPLAQLIVAVHFRPVRPFPAAYYECFFDVGKYIYS